MLAISKGTAHVSISLTTGIVPTFHAMCGRMVPRATVGAFIVSECARTDFTSLDGLVKRYRVLRRAEKAISKGKHSHIAYSDTALEGLRDAYMASLKRYAELNPLCITIEYNGDYVDDYKIEYLTQVLVKGIADGKLSLNDRF